MDSDNDSSESLQDELARLRKRVAELEHAEALRQSKGRDPVLADRMMSKQMSGTRIDNTERGYGEMALVRSEQKYKTLIQSIDAIVWEADAQMFEFSFVSEQAEQLLGYPVECWTSSPHFWAAHLHPDDRESAIASCLAATKERQNHEFEYRMIAADGREVWLHDRVTVVAYDGEPLRLRGIMFDITERKRAEERFAKVFHFSPVAIMIAALSDGRVIDVNRHCMELIGYHQDEIIGGTNIGLDVWSEAEKRTLIVQALRNQRPIRDIEANCCSRSGIIRQVLVSAELIDLAGESCALVMFYDTTERKHVEAALRESEARFATVFRASPVAISISTLAEGRHIDVNDSFLAMIGYRREEVIGHTALDLRLWARPADRERLVQALREQGSVQNLEVAQRTRSGELRVALASVELIDLGGEPCILAFLHDITERKRAEQALRDAEAKYRALVEQIPAIIYTAAVDPTSSTRYVSPQIESILGFTPAEWLADPQLWLKQIHPDDRKSVLNDMARAQASDEPVPAEYRAFTRDGRLVWLQDAARVVRDKAGHPVFTQGIALDITERKRVEQALRETQRNLRLIAENTSDSVFAYDLDRRLLYQNAAFEQLTEYSLAELRVQQLINYLHPDDTARMKTLFETVFQGDSFADVEYRIITRSGKVKWCSSSCGPLLDEQGRQIGVQGVERDITERKRLEEAERARIAAEAASRAKSEFLANISHEVRTPMNGIIGMTGLALRTELTDQQREYLGMVAASADALLRIVNDLLDLSKIEAGKLALESVAFDLRRSIADTLEPFAVQARQSGLTLTCEIAPSVPDALVGDPGRLRQVLVNLVGNALKFTEQGKVVVAVSSQQSAVRNELPTADWRLTTGYVLHFSVTDTGVGIPLEKQQLIFEPFAQADNTMNHRAVGAGLGLAISQKLVALMGGQIWVESQVGAGSTFHLVAPFTLRPATEGAAESEAAGPTAPTSRPAVADWDAGRLRILLAEDNSINQRLATALLEQAGHSVTAVGNGAQALAALEREPFDLLLMDVQMPELDGLAATAAIRARERASGDHIPIIAMTARAMHGDRERCLAAGMDSYISKPLELTTFAQAVASLAPATAASAVISQLANDREHPPLSPAWESGKGGEGERHILDLERLRAQTLGNPELLANIIRLFVANYPRQVSEIRAAAADGDVRQAEAGIHSLHGELRCLGAEAAQAAAQTIESLTRRGDLDAVVGMCAELERELERLRAALEEAGLCAS